MKNKINKRILFSVSALVLILIIGAFLVNGNNLLGYINFPLPILPKPSATNVKLNFGNCTPIVLNGDTQSQYNFIIAFNGLDKNEFDQKAYDYARAQFYRSQYDIGKKNDPNFGFTPWMPNEFLSRAGLFEIEPFKSYVKQFNVFYINHSFDNNTNPNSKLFSECPFMKVNTKYSLIVLRHASSPAPNYNTWTLENLGTAFNHEVGHTFGLVDEYYSDMSKNNFTPSQVIDWNKKVPDCDYSRPQTAADYQTGKGYCAKWCQGVDQSKYQEYKTSRDLFDTCTSKLNQKNQQDWNNFCNNSLDFNRYVKDYKFYPTLVVGGNPGQASNQKDACNAIFGDSPNNTYYKQNINEFCYNGSIYNQWDLNIGKSCSQNSGCYAGCGGFSISDYSVPFRGSFGDAMRPTPISIMGGGPLDNSGPDIIMNLHLNDQGLPTYGDYTISKITEKLKQWGIIP